MGLYRIALGALCVYRITLLLHAEDGPWNAMVRLRRLAGDGFLGQLLDCFQCASVWVAVPFALLLGDGWTERLVYVPALSGAAILLERATTGRAPATPVYYAEEANDVVLREGSVADPRPPSREPGAGAERPPGQT